MPSSGADNGLVVLGAVRKQAEQAMKEHAGKIWFSLNSAPTPASCFLS